MSRLADPVVAAAFRAGGRLRKAPTFHPDGVAYPATTEITGELAEPGLPLGSHPSIVRFSRGIGWRRSLPDIQGIGLRLQDVHGAGCHQDVLVAGVISTGWGRVVPCPRWTVSEPFYSTIAPYEGRYGSLLLGMRCLGPDRYDLDGIDHVIAAGRCQLEIVVASGRDPWTPIGTVSVHTGLLPKADELALAFDPSHTAEGFTPTGWLNRLRRPAYTASQEGRAAARGVHL